MTAKKLCWFYFDSECRYGNKCFWPHVDDIDPAQTYVFVSGQGEQRTVAQTMAILRERKPEVFEEYEKTLHPFIAFTTFDDHESKMIMCGYEMPVDEFDSIEQLETRMKTKVWNLRQEFKRDRVYSLQAAYIDEFPYNQSVNTDENS